MLVKNTRSVEAAFRTLTPVERQTVCTLFDRLANWENDEQTRQASEKSAYKNVFVLTTSDDIRISFNLDEEKNEITVLDIMKPSRFEIPKHAAG